VKAKTRRLIARKMTPACPKVSSKARCVICTEISPGSA
jgi:hypothetical protein